MLLSVRVDKSIIILYLNIEKLNSTCNIIYLATFLKHYEPIVYCFSTIFYIPADILTEQLNNILYSKHNVISNLYILHHKIELPRRNINNDIANQLYKCYWYSAAAGAYIYKIV